VEQARLPGRLQLAAQVEDVDLYLRRKLEAAGEPRLLHTVRGAGYILRDG